jgi:hypothetical protein
LVIPASGQAGKPIEALLREVSVILGCKSSDDQAQRNEDGDVDVDRCMDLSAHGDTGLLSDEHGAEAQFLALPFRSRSLMVKSVVDALGKESQTLIYEHI